MHLVIAELALVTLVGMPSHHSSALHTIVLPISLVGAGLVPVVLAEAVNLAALELAVI